MGAQRSVSALEGGRGRELSGDQGEGGHEEVPSLGLAL